jgi:hypothetical protein
MISEVVKKAVIATTSKGLATRKLKSGGTKK